MSSTLVSLGWGPALAASFDEVISSLTSLKQGLVPGRVVRQEREALRVATAAGTVLARPSGRLRHTADVLPVVGDWVALTPGGPHAVAQVHALLPRTSLLQRREAGAAPAGQPFAANVDVVLVVAALDGPLNLRRLERSLALAWGAGASPALVLTKADVCEDVGRALGEAQAVAAGVPLVAVGLQDEGALAEVQALLPPGRTGVLLGPSGVGKSTLVNRLLGKEHLATADVRTWDAKGRHTTTHRELVALPHGGLLVDGPGTRELGLWVGDGEEEAGLGTTFEDVEALAMGCRFRDCRHETEPGCAVRTALEAGTLDAGRLAGWRKLQRELAWARRQVDAAEARAHERRWKQLTAEGWQRSRDKRR